MINKHSFIKQHSINIIRLAKRSTLELILDSSIELVFTLTPYSTAILITLTALVIALITGRNTVGNSSTLMSTIHHISSATYMTCVILLIINIAKDISSADRIAEKTSQLLMEV